MERGQVVGIRLSVGERADLVAAAKAEDRPVSALGRKIIVGWLKANKPSPDVKE